MDKLNLPDRIAPDSTVREAADRVLAMNPDTVTNYDTAMPQNFVTWLIDAGFDPRGKCVTWYGSGIFGKVGGLSEEFEAQLQAKLNGA